MRDCQQITPVVFRAILFFLFLFSPARGQTETMLIINSQAGDFIGQGEQKVLTDKDGLFIADFNFSNVTEGVSIFYESLVGSEYWGLHFSAPNFEPLTVGTYLNATRYPFNDIIEPGLDIYSTGRGCNTLTGNFEVLSIVYGVDNTLESFAANFEQHCEGESPALFGTIYYNFDLPDDPPSGPIDSDDDGLNDDQETIFGTNPNVPDSDRDSVLDGQEIADGSDPLDRGSNLPFLRTNFCTNWNGFLGGSMLNVFEHVNIGPYSSRTISTSLYSNTGSRKGIEVFNVLHGEQHDHIINSMDGFTIDAYGKVCSTVSSGYPGEFDGRMVFYKRAIPSADIDFAYSIPLTNGLTGSQYVGYNTFHPSLAPEDQKDTIANWITISNLENTSQSGKIIFYNQSGTAVSTKSVTLGPRSRRDYGAHQLGLQKIGQAKWIPKNTRARFQFANERYVYDNPIGRASFDAVFQLEGRVGSGERLAAPVDTRGASSIISVSNTTKNLITADLRIYTALGGLKKKLSLSLPPFASKDIIVDGILRNGLGLATVKGSAPSSVNMTVMQYGRTANGGIQYLYGIQGKEALDRGTLLGSYNTTLNQGCRLLMGNSRGQDVLVAISVTRSDGTVVFGGETTRNFLIPAHGIYDFNLCAVDSPYNIGLVKLEPDVEDSIVATIIRIGENKQYRFPTEVR